MQENLQASNFIFNWMSQSGIVKKLQLALCLSLIINIALIQNIVMNRAKEIQTNEQNIQTSIKQETIIEINQAELQQILENYLSNFFKTDAVAFAHIKSLSTQELFENKIEPELLNRQDIKLNAEFKLSDCFFEALEANKFKAIAIGQELFLNGDYQNREIEIELEYDAEIKKFYSINRFKAQ